MRSMGMIAAAALALGGCAELYAPAPIGTAAAPGQVLSAPASISGVVISDAESATVFCAQPAPDALFDQGEAADVSVSLIQVGDGDDSASEESSSSEVEMAGRTPGVLMAREIFYRTCEFTHNQKLSKEEATTLFTKALDLVGAGWQGETAKTTITVGDTVSDSATTATSASASETESAADQTTTTRSDSAPSS